MDRTRPSGNLNTGHHVPSHIRHVRVGDRVIILDIRSESYFALDPVASLMWEELIAGRGRDECLRRLGEEISGTPQEIEDDLYAFSEKCLARGLMRESPEAPAGEEAPRATRAWKRFLTFRAWWSLVRTRLSLSRKGFCTTYNSALAMAYPGETSGDNAGGEALERALTAFAAAESFFPLGKARLDHLPRSLALFTFLRRTGLPVCHCIGVRPFPFSAHAWTECHGRVVHDDALNRNRFTIIARIPK
ncbi:MAG: lasso peptide biosynthesis B2 protein [Syntrophorhabdus sp.]|nr:lasso peptide biosynthesis B2 protein [Syntrophorhabdus sp.]